jgi:hypothetical protein
MALSERDLEQVGDYVRARILDWIPVPVLNLNERIVRVEEELKLQRELMQRGFDEMDRRFGEMDRRFEDANKRFLGQNWLIGIGFVLLSTLMSLYTFLA